MKILLTALLVTITLGVNAQKADTTKPKQYFLIGELPAWQLLFKAVNEPGKITRDEVAALSNWLNRVQEIPADTIQKPKTEGK